LVQNGGVQNGWGVGVAGALLARGGKEWRKKKPRFSCIAFFYQKKEKASAAAQRSYLRFRNQWCCCLRVYISGVIVVV
jgi:hypothetical protein